MAKLHRPISDHTFEMSVNPIPIHSMLGGHVPDPDWTYIDSGGHGHFYAKNGVRYPTLIEFTHVEHDWDAGDYTVHDRWECPHCGEHIVPGTKYVACGVPQTVSGEKCYKIDGEIVDRPAFVTAYREMRMAWLEQELDTI